MSSRYWALHDNYVPNRWSQSSLASLVLTVGCLVVIGVLTSIALTEKSTAKRNSQHLGDQVKIAWDTSNDLGDPVSDEQSKFVLVESIPLYMTYNVNATFGTPLYKAWKDLLAMATKSVDVASFYWTLTGDDIRVNSSTDLPGRDIFKLFQDLPSRNVLVKELGVVIYNCSQLAEDLEKIFLSYWVLGHYNASIPDPWPSDFDTSINTEHPLLLNMSGVASRVYISASPPSFCPAGRTKDLDSILSVIEGAEQFIDVSVMEYFPTSRFTHPKRYWPIIEDALKQSAFDRQVPIRLLISCGQDTDPAMLPFLQSLSALHQPSQNISIEVKLFIVPVGNQSNIPYSRVNHNKYMVTDKETYIGTSNWSADYFITTAGVSLVVSQDVPHPSSVGQTLQEQLRGVFERDWNSQFSVALSDLGHHPDCSFTERPRKTAS
ncbi:5'-3' exonuclease PLD4 isoform X2 [Megalops cyprinoides]|uniref:5'-3' exonuclease PLD4 isoform X2 n=1 Tax=Megalops cyprinoides TaxID=118141 RepID=UPI001863BD59|nr:5'-3' exonuclease PLD4 isoform X2 [Megalops cyprinoides]